MLLKQATLRRVIEGQITAAYRYWKRPTVKTGGTLMTALGMLDIREVTRVDVEELSERDAVAAGFNDLGELRRNLQPREGAALFRVGLAWAGEDPRVALRASLPSPDDLEQLISQLRRWDARRRKGPWVESVLQLIRECPGVRAGDLSEQVGLEQPEFKRLVRRLKGLGLTESLEVGYRVSPRGLAVLNGLDAKDSPTMEETQA